jgi:homogentisate 1,2-dioxygenase
LQQLTKGNRSEALPGANTVAANSPQVPPYALLTERISGSAFTAPRAQNLQTWLYRVKSSLDHEEYTPYETPNSSTSGHEGTRILTPNALKWNDFDMEPGHDWVSSQRVVAQAGDVSTKTGLAYLVYAATEDMAKNTVFFSSDGDFLIVPQSGTLDIHTELGNLLVR